MLDITRQQRLKLDPYLLAADKQQLAALRAALTSNSNFDFQLRRLVPLSESTRRQQQRQGIRVMQQAMPVLQQLTLKYRAPISQLLAELEPQRQQWLGQLLAINNKYAASHSPTDRRISYQTQIAHLLDPTTFLLIEPAPTRN